MFNSARYLATVRRANLMPRSFRILTISESESGFVVSSLEISSLIASLMLVLASDSPSWVLYPEVKKYLIGKIPHGVWMYLLATARLTVVSWTPTFSAT